ncbi:MAG: prepilin peptidase [Clostridiales bacterium]|nr:prepilin peptidase [Clostridiales bacterium]MBO4580436.1 prepilin peptidase [Clostridiales bacterium]
MNLFYLIAIALGIGMGFLLTLIFAHLPEKWLQDYDYDEKAPNFRLSKRMKVWPHGVIAAIACAVCYVLAVFFCDKAYIATFRPLHLVSIVLLIPVLVLVTMADRLNRIIPDQFSIFIAIVGILTIVSDLTEGSVWFSEGCAWYIPVLNKVIGSILGGGFLWLIGFISESFLGREGMGQGDMRLLFATGLITGCYGLIVLIYVAVFSALIFAIPLFIRKRIRVAKEEEIINKSDNPALTRRRLEREKAQIHFADDPDYLAFGPFLAAGCAVFAIADPFIFEKVYDMLVALGVYF